MRSKTVRVLSIFLAMLMIFCSGCGNLGDSGADSPADNNGENNKNIKGEEKETDLLDGIDSDVKAMGRYIESENSSISVYLSAELDIVRMKDGSFTLFDVSSGMWVSEDAGETWEGKSLKWYEELKVSSYIMDISVSEDGYIGVIHCKRDTKESASEEENKGYSVNPEYKIISPDGTVLDFSIPYRDAELINKLHFSQDSRMFGSAINGNVYEINKENGSCDLITELSGQVYHIASEGKLLICVNADGLTMIDLDTKEVIEDIVMDDFISSLGIPLASGDGATLPLYVMLKENNILYLACEKGIYRHVIGGNAMEQVADGALSSLGNPSYGIAGGILLEDDSFFMLFTNGSMIRYTYDAAIPTVPDIQLKAYSLKENDSLRQAISFYQVQNPAVYIRYEVGIDAKSSVTREDAIRKLNTEMVAGTGPDLIILDDLPINSYIDKGILMDLAPYLTDIKEKEDIFVNLLDAFKTQTGTYAVPVQFTLPLLVGKESYMEQVTDLKTLADQIELIKNESLNGNKRIFGARSEEELLVNLLPVCAPAWITEDGKINENALEEFFIDAKRIWDAEATGLTDKDREKYNELLKSWTASGMSPTDRREMNSRLKNQLMPEHEIELGVLSSSYAFDETISIIRTEGQDITNFYEVNGQAPNVYIPRTIVGINSKTSNAKEAGDILAQLLGSSHAADWKAFTVNKKAWNNHMTANATPDGSAYVTSGGGDDEGNIYFMDIYPASKEEIKRLEKIIESAVNPYIRDSVLEDAVCEAGVKILRDEINVDTGVLEIVRKLAIYLAE